MKLLKNITLTIIMFLVIPLPALAVECHYAGFFYDVAELANLCRAKTNLQHRLGEPKVKLLDMLKNDGACKPIWDNHSKFIEQFKIKQSDLNICIKSEQTKAIPYMIMVGKWKKLSNKIHAME